MFGTLNAAVARFSAVGTFTPDQPVNATGYDRPREFIVR
jgi:hypothetical protein